MLCLWVCFFINIKIEIIRFYDFAVLRLASLSVLTYKSRYLNRLKAKDERRKYGKISGTQVKFHSLFPNTHSLCVLIMTVFWLEGCLKVAVGQYTMRVCIFRVACTLLAGCCIVYLKFGKIKDEYPLTVCIRL